MECQAQSGQQIFYDEENKNKEIKIAFVKH